MLGKVQVGLLAAERFDFAGGALGGIRGDPFEDRDALLQPRNLAVQPFVLAGQQFDLAAFVDRVVAVAEAAAAPAVAFVFERVAVLGADPGVNAPRAMTTPTMPIGTIQPISMMLLPVALRSVQRRLSISCASWLLRLV